MSKYIDLKESVSKNTKKFYDGWKKIVNMFKNGILRLSKKVGAKTDSGDQQTDNLDMVQETKFNDFLCQIKEKQKNRHDFV